MIVFLHGSVETIIPLDVLRIIRDEDLKGNEPGRLEKQDLQSEEVNGPIIPMSLAGSEDRDNPNASCTGDRNLSSELDTTFHAVERTGLVIFRGIQ